MAGIDRKLLASLMIMGSVVEARDAYTGGHLWRVGQYARLLAETIGLDRHGILVAAVGGFLHDLGKVGIPDAILNGRHALNEHQRAVIRTHPGIGRTVLMEHPLAPLALDAIAHHHERLDGTGYPDGLAGEAIPLPARIVALCDAFDAMTSTRSYRVALPTGQALATLAEGRGRQFDPALADSFLALARAGRLDHIIGHSHHGHRLAECPRCGPVVATHGKEDGALHVCRSCGDEYRLHRRGESYELEATGRQGSAHQLQPLPDMAPIHELLDLAS
jgi:response regulator RpfG family c-di-GMP phosphodiesterase